MDFLLYFRIALHYINKELRQLVRDRDREKIEAIKKAQEVLGLSLLEAKNYVDSL